VADKVTPLSHTYRYEKMRKHARITIEKHLSWETVIPSWIKVFEEIER